MKQRYFHLLALLSLISINSFSFGEMPEIGQGRRVDVQNAYDDEVISEFQKDQKYSISEPGSFVTYSCRGEFATSNKWGTEYKFSEVSREFNCQPDLVLLRLDNGEFLITWKRNGDFVHRVREWIYLDGENKDKHPSFFEIYQHQHPWQVRAGYVAATLGGLWLLKEVYNLWCGSKRAPKKALSKKK